MQYARPMRRPWLLAFALATLACPSPDGSADTSDSSDGSESDDDVAEDNDTTDESEGSGDDVPDCTPGAWGCTCAEGDMCSPDLACIEGMCTFSDCPAGYADCMCGEGDVCLDGLFCVEGICGCLPGTLGCGCIDGATCEGGLDCIAGECWLASSYPNCGWDAAHAYYYCGFGIAHPDYPIDCPLDLVEGEPCPAELTYIGCCDTMGTWWCQNGVNTYAPC
jgi:hypothetical protein